jgi:ABC-type polysaccharide/polyol phosphate transport system ATPase subunit
MDESEAFTDLGDFFDSPVKHYNAGMRVSGVRGGGSWKY